MSNDPGDAAALKQAYAEQSDEPFTSLVEVKSRLGLPLSTVSKQDWRTPRWFFEAVQARLGVTFGLDVAASAANTLCGSCFYDGHLGNGLLSPWTNDAWNWCNPPYRHILPWVEKALMECHEHGASSVVLLPARLEARWYTAAAPYVKTQVVTPRLAFEGGDGTSPPHGSMLLIVTPETLANPTGLHNLRVEVANYVKPGGRRKAVA